MSPCYYYNIPYIIYTRYISWIKLSVFGHLSLLSRCMSHALNFYLLSHTGWPCVCVCNWRFICSSRPLSVCLGLITLTCVFCLVMISRFEIIRTFGVDVQLLGKRYGEVVDVRRWRSIWASFLTKIHLKFNQLVLPNYQKPPHFWRKTDISEQNKCSSICVCIHFISFHTFAHHWYMSGCTRAL